MKNTYDFPVSTYPIEVAGKVVPGKKGVVREDTKDTLGIVSDKYQIITHTEVVNSFREVLPKDTEEKIEVKNNGAVLFAKFTIPSIQIEVKKGDFVALQLVVKNSYNGNNSMQITLGALRLVCSNGMVIGKRFFSYSQRHQGDASVKIGLLLMQIEVLVNHFKKSAEVMKEMAGARLSSPPSYYFEPKKVGLPSYLVQAAEAEYIVAKDNTRWGLYNALTHAITHDIKRNSPQLAIEYGSKAWHYASTNA